jgi:hypothetical protein
MYPQSANRLNLLWQGEGWLSNISRKQMVEIILTNSVQPEVNSPSQLLATVKGVKHISTGTVSCLQDRSEGVLGQRSYFASRSRVLTRKGFQNHRQ